MNVSPHTKSLVRFYHLVFAELALTLSFSHLFASQILKQCIQHENHVNMDKSAD